MKKQNLPKLLQLVLLLPLALIFAESFFFPGVVEKYLLLPINWVVLAGIAGALVYRLVLRQTVDPRAALAMMGVSVAGLYLHLLFTNLNYYIHVTYSAAHFHMHSAPLQLFGLYASVLALLSISRELWQKYRSLVIFIAPFWATGLMYEFSVYSERLFWHLEKEDSVTEYLTFAAYLGASWVAAKMAWWFKNQTKFPNWLRWGLTAAYMLAAIGFFVIAGEEISWAQRIIGFETPEEIAANNTQFEFNLHNNRTIFRYVYWAYMALASYLAFSWILFKGIGRHLKNNLFDLASMLLSPPFYMLGFFVQMIFYVIVRKKYGDVLLDRWEEYFEFLLVFGMLLFLRYSFRKVQKFSFSK